MTNLGPASLSSSIATGLLTPDKAYVVSRGITPANLGVLDRGTGLVDTTSLPRGQGAWASAATEDGVFVASYLPAVLYRVSDDGLATEIAAPDGLQLFYDMAAAPDGLLVAGGYPKGHLYTFDPTTGATTDLGQAAPNEQYVRSVIADETTLYAGVGSHARLVAFDRASGAKREILPEELRSDAFVYDLALTQDYVIAGLNPSGRVAIINKSDPTDYRIVRPDPSLIGGVDAITVAGQGENATAYVTLRPTGNVFAIGLATGAVTNLGTPVYGQETRNLFVEDGRLIGFPSSGGMWTRDLESGDLSILDLQEAGLTPGPELPLSIAANRSQVLVGGNFGVQVHDLATGRSKRVRVAGEPKASLILGQTAFLATYPSGALDSLDLTTGKVSRHAVFGHGQIRPRDMVHGSGLFLVGTQPEYGQLGGALVVVDDRTFDTDVYRDVVPNQSVSSVATADGTAYLGSEIHGGIGSVPSEKEAVLAFFDLESREVEDSLVPVPGANRIQDLAVIGSELVGVTNQGVLFAVDRGTREVVRTKKISTRGGELEYAGTKLIFNDGDTVRRLDPRTWRSDVLASGLRSTLADGALVASADQYFATAGTDLVRIGIP